MAAFLIGRFGRMILTVLGVIVLTFILSRATGDPVALMLPQTATMDDYNRIRASLGIDQPLPTQFAIYLSGVVRGDLGRSIVSNRAALDLVVKRIPATLELGIPTLILSTMLGIPLGILCARRRGSALDRAILIFSLAWQSLPAFFIGIVLILFFGVWLGVLPTVGREGTANLILPTLTFTIYPLAFIIRLTRSSVLETLVENYVRTASAKGLSNRRVLYVHALRNAVIPVLTVFAFPGIGLLAVQSIGARDYPVIQTIVLISAAAFGIANMGVDLLYTVVDPRIRAG